MISKLRIKNYVLIDEVEIDFEKGLNVISGETGAGKSIILSAISFALGNKTDKSVIMPNKNFCSVEIVFSDISHNVLQCLNEFGIVIEEGTLILSRKLTADGRNDIRANGELINLSTLKRITENLIEIYGQHACQVLLDERKHVDLVDAFIELELEPIFKNLKELINSKQEVEEQLNRLNLDESYCERQKQMLKFEIVEIEEANLKDNEDVELDEILNKMKHTQKIVDSIESVLYCLKGNENCNVLNLLYDSEKKLNLISNIDESVLTIEKRIESTRIELDDVESSLKDILASYDFSEEDFRIADERHDLINALKRKYGATIKEIKNYSQTAQQELDMLEHSAETIEVLKHKKIELETDISKLCGLITQKRTMAARTLEKQLITELRSLGLNDSKFEIEITNTDITFKGQDKVSFLFCANKGQKLMQLSKVISGGEMSRFMLAFDIVFGLDKFGTLIFDEIDTGISGEVSYLVAQKMYTLSRKSQTVVITHLPVICAMADVNFKVVKQCVNEKTITEVQKLDSKQNIEEIARLAGGVVLSQLSIKNAEELKFLCTNQKIKVMQA